jgi:curli biogenesis system outer membrane secretion channel CsgG
MRRFLLGAVGAVALGSLAHAETKVQERDLASLLVHCDAPVATVAIGAFRCKAAACSEQPAASPGMAQLLALAAAAQGGVPQSYPQLGQGMSNAMATALTATGCVTVLAREDLEDLQREAALAGVQLKTQGADYLVAGAITSLGVNSSTKSFGGGLLPVVGAVSKSTKSATVGIDVRLVDVKVGTVVGSRSFDANSQRSSWGTGVLGYGGSGALFGRASSTQSPELDSVANETVINAANYLIDQIAPAAITKRPVPVATK